MAPVYFWQDKTGREVDFLLETPTAQGTYVPLLALPAVSREAG